MADAFYEEFRNAIFGEATHSVVDLSSGGDTINILLRDEGTTAINLATQVDLADISSAGVGTDQTVGTQTVGSAGVGAFDHAIVTWTGLTGATVESLDYYKSSGIDSTSPLIANIDSATGLPLTPNSGDVTFDPAAGGVFQIT